MTHSLLILWGRSSDRNRNCSVVRSFRCLHFEEFETGLTGFLSVFRVCLCLRLSAYVRVCFDVYVRVQMCV